MDALVLVTIFTTAVVVSTGLTPIVLKFAKIYGLYDHPDEAGRRIHTSPIPRLGGITILVSFLVCYLVWKANTALASRLLISSLLIFILGIMDDLLNLPAKARFFFQIAIASFAIISSNLVPTQLSFFPGTTTHIPYIFGFLLSVFILVGAINALNMVDGLDGLAGGICVIAISALSYLYFKLSHDTNLIIYFGIPIIGAILGFLRFNTYPASIFMGDSGSNWLGFIIGLQILLILSLPTQDVNVQPVTLASVIMCFAIPVLDTASVIFTRIKNGLPPMKPDKRHFHHTLLRIGLTQSQSVVLIYFLSVACCIFGLMPVLYPNFGFEWIPILGATLMAAIIAGAFSVHTKFKDSVFRLAVNINQIGVKNNPRFTRLVHIWERTNKYLLFLILAISPIFAGAIPLKIGYAAVPALVLLLTASLFRPRSNDFLESLAITIACFVLLLANNYNPLQVEIGHTRYSIHHIYNILFILLFVSSICFLVFTIKRRYLVLTPSDFLMLAFPIILMLLPNEVKSEFRIDIISLRCQVIFLGYRVLEKKRMNARRHIKMATTFALIYLILTSVVGMRLVYH
jgi:UDP-GlcNAc:undecaprenyl-phosphate GlcNAc-1-phosphate transferase